MGKEQEMRLVEFENQQGETIRAVLSPAESDTAVVCLHGFERLSEERKFANLELELRGRVAFLRLDHSGCGLSDGSFEDLTVEKLAGEVGCAIRALKEESPQIKKLHLVAHSLGACVAVKYAVEYPEEVDRLVLLSPALNQRSLLRYWFVSSTVKDKEITWENYEKFMDEETFGEFARQDRKEMKGHWLGSAYHLECMNRDFQDLLGGIDVARVLVVYGDKDDDVPRESNHRLPDGMKAIRVAGGNHDLEKPTMVEQYLDEVVEFLTG